MRRRRGRAARRGCSSFAVRLGTWHEATFADLPGLLTPGDLVVANDTRVVPARLLGRRDPSGGAVECLLLGTGGEAEIARRSSIPARN